MEDSIIVITCGFTYQFW